MYGEVNCSYEDITQVTGRLEAAVARRVVKTTEPLGRGMLKTDQCSGLNFLFSLSSCSESKVHKTPQHPHHHYHHDYAHLDHQDLWRHAHMGCVQTHERKIEEEWFRGIVVPDYFARFLAEKINKIR